jgi:tetratricopeptide (TPR) repeat protein
LFDLGKYDDAIVDQDLAISLSEKGDVIAHCAKADMLRILGRFDDALSTLGLARRAATTRLPLDMVRSRVFRDRGNFDASRGVLEDLGKVYPKDVGSRIALAELDRKEGLFDTALEKFLILEKNEAGGRPSRNSMAATFGALGEYEKAISYLPIRSTSTRSDWVAQHIRAMITMKSGDYTTAAALLTEGLESVSGLVTAGTAAMIAALRVHASLIDNAQARARELLLDIPEVGNSPLVARYISALREACFERHVDDRGVSDAEWSMFMGMAA